MEEIFEPVGFDSVDGFEHPAQFPFGKALRPEPDHRAFQKIYRKA
jgi:hypothetical protein